MRNTQNLSREEIKMRNISLQRYRTQFLENLESAGDIFEELQLYKKSANVYIKAEKYEKAAKSYEKIGNYNEAGEFYFKS